MDRTLIEKYANQADVLTRWTSGLSPAELTGFPVPGTWSIQQLVMHMLDSDLIATHRMRRIAAEEMPLLISYDETLFAKNLDYQHADVKLACDLFALNRKFTSAFLRQLPEASFARAGVHNQRGKVTIADFVQIYVHHVEHHEPFLIEKRRVLGKPMR
jgi:uncharacterized damage-inducible protein DinB